MHAKQAYYLFAHTIFFF